MRLLKTATLLTLLWFASGIAYANWTATGTFRYVDREFDQNGFTGAQPSLPIRLANVEVRDFNATGPKALLATGSTDANGNFSIAVTDSKTRTVYVRVVSASTAVATLYLRVENVLTPKNPYSVASSNVPNHSPNTNVNFGTITASIGAGGEAFNLYDVGLRSIDYIASLNGSRPGSANLLTLEWEPAFGNPVSSYDYGNKRVHVGDPSGYNDTVVQHETGHYAYHLNSANDNPGGTHHLTDCNQDLRLAFEEGRATWFGQSVRRFYGLSRPDLYVKTTGAPGAGNL
ncbi:MAG: transthyretin-like family protein, partial [Acidobacteria bacterium]|nr:transthyretin-like family protein [Acidobacteriota bacterium]